MATLRSGAEPPQLACELPPPEAYLAAYARTLASAQAAERRLDWRQAPDTDPDADRARPDAAPGCVIEIDIA